MIPYFGRHSSKQFIRGKPVRFGYKVTIIYSLKFLISNINRFGPWLLAMVLVSGLKNTVIILNLKDEYTRCIIPDLVLIDRSWVEGGLKDHQQR